MIQTQTSNDDQTPACAKLLLGDVQISNEMLADAHDKLYKSFQPIQEVFDKCQAEFQKAKKELEDSFKEFLSIYYDQKLLDSNSKSVRITDLITDGKDVYYVFDRGMQIVFGTMLYNNSVKCYKLDKNLQQGKKVHSFSFTQLSSFTLHVA